jgi:hypothetical protein
MCLVGLTRSILGAFGGHVVHHQRECFLPLAGETQTPLGVRIHGHDIDKLRR